ncbi:UNVERIFIED_CONTAM: hypothetical protein Sindi_2922600 [Sesamum indicum]
MAVHMKYPVKRFETLARIGGAGYQVLAKLDHYARSPPESLLTGCYNSSFEGENATKRVASSARQSLRDAWEERLP